MHTSGCTVLYPWAHPQVQQQYIHYSHQRHALVICKDTSNTHNVVSRLFNLRVTLSHSYHLQKIYVCVYIATLVYISNGK